jgi:arylsulfatase A-like enzyme
MKGINIAYCCKTVITICAPISLTVSGTSYAQEFKSSLKPNIVLIYADDVGYGDLSCYGATKVHTPNIDRLAEQGRMFTDAHSASAVCTPSRYSLLTGEYSFRKGLSKPIFLKDTLIIDTQKLTIGRLMKEAGYSTACIGKWHLGFGKEYPVNWNKELKPGPLELGFDYYFGVPVVNSHPPFVFVENHHVVGYDPDDPFVYEEKAETKPFREKMELDQIGGAKAAHVVYVDEQVGTTLKNKAIEWIKSQKNKPFFLYLATTNIHHPFTPAPQFKGTSEAGIYGDFIQELDWIVGEVLSTLDDMDVAKNTLVIFTSDNGGMLNMGGQEAWMAGHRLNGNLLGFKFDAWEGGHRIPFIARWPGKIPAGSTSNHLISNVDILATFAEIVNYRIKAEDAKDSYNVLQSLTGYGPQERDHLVISPSTPSHIALRQGRWLYIGKQGNGGFPGKKIGDHNLGGPAAFLLTKQVNSDISNGEIKEDAPQAQLYNLMADPFQTKNVYNEFPKVVEEMKTKLMEYLKGERTAPI